MSDEKASLFELQFHELAQVHEGLDVMRVPGGWLYIIPGTSTCFVPEPPLQFEKEVNEDETDQQAIELLKAIIDEVGHPEEVTIKANRLIRMLIRRSKSKEPEL